MKTLHKISGFAVVVALAGCVNFAPHASLLGQDKQAVMASLGPPSQERRTADGTRLVYARSPYGKSTFFVSLDGQGRVKGWEDVLTPANFEKITVGMGKDDVENLIGPSTIVRTVNSRGHKAWLYPYHNSLCQVFMVEVNPQNQVVGTGNAPAPECENVAE